MAKPTIILLPGAWHSPLHFEKLKNELEKHGYEAEGVALATVNPKDPANTDVDSDVEVISHAIKRVLSSGKDAVLVTHSYSGSPGQSAAYSFIKEKPDGPRLRAIAMICSFLIPAQQSLLAPNNNEPMDIHNVSADGNLVTVGGQGAEHYFYNDIDPEEAAQAKAKLQVHSWRATILPPSSEGSGFWGIPTSYLICEKDQAIPAAFQRQMIAGANETLKKRGSALKIREEVVEAGHSPFMSMPTRTADFIRRTAGEDLPM